MRHSKYFKKTIVHASILSGILDHGWYLHVFTPYFRACALFFPNSSIYTTYANYRHLRDSVAFDGFGLLEPFFGAYRGDTEVEQG